MKKTLGDGAEEGVEYWSENDEQTAADDGKEENEIKEEKTAVTDSQNENGNTIPYTATYKSSNPSIINGHLPNTDSLLSSNKLLIHFLLKEPSIILQMDSRH